MGKKLAGMAGILGSYQVDLVQDAYGAERDILQVADRRSDDVE